MVVPEISFVCIQITQILPLNYYDILEISKSASGDEIKKAYRRLARKFHPDVNKDAFAEEHFIEIQLAYETLSDSEKRKQYDITFVTGFINLSRPAISYFFSITSNKSVVKVCEEFELIFIYAGEGRYLRKPDLRFFQITGRPRVHFRNIMLEGYAVKETTIIYSIAGMQAGFFSIGPAMIKIENKTYDSGTIDMKVEEAKCFFSNGVADGKPLKVKLYYNAETGGQHHHFKENLSHAVFIPRSHKAKVYHDIGYWLKLIFIFWGFIMAAYLQKNILLGMALGSLYGAIAAYFLYAIARVKPIFYFAQKNAEVKKHLQNGFTAFDESAPYKWLNIFLGHLGRLLS